MKTLLAQIQTQLNNNNKNGVNDNITSDGNKSNKVLFWIQFYFWTHGACNHKGSRLPSNAEVHKDTATLDKQLNESDHNCHHHKKEKPHLTVCYRH